MSSGSLVKLPCNLGLFAVGVVTCVLLAGCGAGSTSSTSSPVPRIAQGVSVAGIEVGGLTQAQARARVGYFARLRLNKAHYVLLEPRSGRKFRYSAADFGGYYATQPAVASAMKA